MTNLSEAPNDEHKVTKLGGAEVKLLKTTYADKHVQDLLNHVSGGDQKKIDAIKREVEERIKKLDCVAKVSPVLYEAALDNIIEAVIFAKYDRTEGKKNPIAELIDKLKSHEGYIPDGQAPDVKTASKFSVVIFSKLVSKIKAESRSFFPLRNMVDFHVIHNPAFVIVGDGLNEKNEKRYASVKTAAATADGTFIFNVKFCQAFIDFAHLKGVKPPDNRYGKKYVSQGGSIPDDYQFLEFLIRHELMHYTYADFHYQKVIPGATGKLINYVGDFRSNHKLVQQGFAQPPIGLFSSYVNFHRQGSYQAMYNLVKSEYEKLADQCKEEVDNELGSSMDDHHENGNNSDGTPKQVDRNVKPEDIDKWNDKVKDKTTQDADNPPDYDTKPPQERDPGAGKGGSHALDYKTISPRYKWDALLKKMVGETAFDIDQSYQKISRRAIGTMQQVISRGRGAVKPGEIKNPSKKKIKLAVIVDSSGSMSYVINTVMTNLDKLLVQRSVASGVQDQFFLFIFSGDYEIYECSPGKSGTAEHVTDVDGKKGHLGRLKLTSVLSNHKSGGTVFSSELAGQIKKLASRGYNCLVVSDGDMLHGSNFTNFKELYDSHRRHIWLLLDSKETFSQFITQMKEISNNASHL